MTKKKTKKFPWKKPLILAGVFIVAWLLSYTWTRWRYALPAGGQAAKKLLNCDADKVSEIQIQRTEKGAPTAKLVLKKTITSGDITWSVAEPQLGEADASLAGRLATMFCDIYAPEAVKTDWMSAGFNEDRFNINLQDENNKTVSAVINGASAGRDTWITLEDHRNATKFYRGNPTIKEIIKLPPEKFQNRRVMKLAGDNILELCIEQPAKPRFCFSREGSEWSLARDSKVLGPTTEEADKYVNRIATVQAIEILDLDKSVDECRKRLPAAGFSRVQLIGVADRKEYLFISMKTTDLKSGEKVLVACDSARNSVFGIHPSLVKYLRVEPYRLLAKKR